MSWLDTLKNGLNVAAGGMQGYAGNSPYAKLGQSAGNAMNAYRQRKDVKKGMKEGDDALSNGIDQAIKTAPTVPLPPPPPVPPHPLDQTPQPDEADEDPGYRASIIRPQMGMPARQKSYYGEA
jgi:hypothetical protein